MTIKLVLRHLRVAGFPRGIKAQLLVGVTLGFLAASVGHAQSSASSSASAASADQQGLQELQEVNVTARRREERLLDVPTVVAVVGSQEILNYNIVDTKGLTEAVPNLMILSSFAGTGGTIAIRGLASFAANSDPGVSPEAAYNIDGINITQGRTSTLALLDVNQVEVLMGPQALYFGKNNPAGVVAVTSVDPGKTSTGYAHFGYEFHLVAPQMAAALTMPISDDLSVRVAVLAQEQRGYLRNTAVPLVDPFGYAPLIDPGPVNKYIDGSWQTLGRVSLKYTPTDRFTALLKFVYGIYNANSDGANQVVLCAPGVNDYVVSANFGHVAIDPAYPNCSQSGSQNAPAIEGGLNATLATHFPGSNGGVPFSQNTTNLSSLNLSYQFDPLTLTSITGYYMMNSHALVGIESSIPFYIGQQNLNYNQFSEELRATSTLSGPLNYMLGAYYEDNWYKWLGSNYVLPLGPDTVTGRIDSQTYDDVQTDRTYALYGALYWKLPANLELSAGARWTHESKLATLQSLYLNDQPQLQFGFPFFQPVGQVITSPTSGSNVSPEVTLTWHVQPDVNIYGAYKTGYKSGGTSTPEVLNITTAANLQFKPETATGGELGLKGEWLDRTLRATFDVYNYNFKNLQVTALQIIPNEPLIFTIQNAAGARTRGAEFQTNYLVTKKFELRAHVDYNQAIYTDYANAPCSTDQEAGLASGCVTVAGVGSQDFTGKRIPLAPEWFAGAGGTYTQPLSNGLQLAFDADVNYTGDFVRAYGLEAFGTQGGYTLLNANLRLSNPAKNWEVALAGTNLSNVVTYTSMFNINGTPGGIYSGLRGPPREVTLMFSYGF
jgi:outer membrane receptor protein involved in Fe transport